MGDASVSDQVLPADFMDHLQFFAGEVAEDELLPLLPPGYPLIFAKPDH